MNDPYMTPLDTLLREIFEVDPSFTVVYDAKSGKTQGICQYNAEFEGNSLSAVIITVWLYYFKEKVDNVTN
jgi:hypothetical protein